MENLIKLYKNPPEFLFCFDECPGIQILKRLTPDMYPGDKGGMLKWINDFEYIRNGTTDLFAFLDVNTGTIKASFHADHKKETFIAEFKRHVSDYPQEAVLNYIMDNLAGHYSYELCLLVAELSDIACPTQKELRTPDQRRQWLQSDSKRIIIHFTPFHGSWLNMAEIVFRLINEKVLKDSYGTPDELHTAVGEFVKAWNEDWAHPFSWRYNGEGLHKKVVQRFTSILKHSASSITLQYLTKSSQLMVNTMVQYWDDVPLETWSELFSTINEQEEVLRTLIKESKQPIVKINAKEMLDTILNKINTVDLKAKIAA
jgi:transposase